jgi:hypothetical protein
MDDKLLAWLVFYGIGMTLSLTMIFIIYRVGRRVFKNPWSKYANADLLNDGLPTQATILKMWQTGTVFNNNPQIGLHLQIQSPDDGSIYEVETKVVLPQFMVVKCQEGATMPVKVDPNDRNRVALAPPT